MSIIIRVPRHDEDMPSGSTVAINVLSSGPHPLDLSLIGTEGENPYTLNLRQDSVYQYRSANAHGSDLEWEKLLQSIFISRSPRELTDVEIIVTELIASSSLTLTVRRNVEGITSRLGSFRLIYDEDQVIDPIDWISVACLRSSAIHEELERAERLVVEKNNAIQQLQLQIEEFTRLSHEHENNLLCKFVKLLNSKKAKIRDQQRLLASSTVDIVALERITSQRKPLRTRERTNRKRKAQLTQDESDDFESIEDRASGSSYAQARHNDSEIEDTASDPAEESSDEATGIDRSHTSTTNQDKAVPLAQRSHKRPEEQGTTTRVELRKSVVQDENDETESEEGDEL